MPVTTERGPSPRGSGGMFPQKNLKSRSSEMRFPVFWASKGMLFLCHLKVSVVVVVVLLFIINIIFILINKKSYRWR